MVRKKLSRLKIQLRIASETHETVKIIAETLGYTYAEEGSIGKMLDAIASGELILIHRPNRLQSN